MSATVSFDYDSSDVSRVYPEARTLPPHALASWRAAIAAIVPPKPARRELVLDVGCGTGRFSPMLAEIFDAEVIGIDPSASMLARARAFVSAPRCTFLSGSLEALPVTAHSADVVFLSMVIHHVRDWPAARHELERVLRPGGVVIVRTPLKASLEKYLWSRFFPAALAFDLQRMPAMIDVIAWLSGAGLTLALHRTVSHRFADTAESYLEKIRLRGLSALRMISDDDFANGLASLEQYLRTAPTDASTFTEDMDLFSFVKP